MKLPEIDIGSDTGSDTEFSDSTTVPPSPSSSRGDATLDDATSTGDDSEVCVQHAVSSRGVVFTLFLEYQNSEPDTRNVLTLKHILLPLFVACESRGSVSLLIVSAYKNKTK